MSDSKPKILVEIATDVVVCKSCERTVFPYREVYRVGRALLCAACFRIELSKRRAAARAKREPKSSQ